METQMIQETGRNSSAKTTSNTFCSHQRAIDDVRTRGRRTGKVRCLECGAIFDDPYQGSK